jgi:hypothetical protein
MKTKNALLCAATLTLASAPLLTGSETQSTAPTTDGQGRFWVYRNGPTQPRMPFTPYGWMSDATNNLPDIIKLNVECHERPNTAFRVPGKAERESCIEVKLNWDGATWAGVAFISGPDKPAWWGETDKGKYFNLSGLSKKKLVLNLRGERGGEMVKVQFGVLSGKPYGDSLSKPFVSEEFKLTKEWVRQEIDLSTIPTSELTRICNGFGVVADQASQPGPGKDTTFYIDDVYFE